MVRVFQIGSGPSCRAHHPVLLSRDVDTASRRSWRRERPATKIIAMSGSVGGTGELDDLTLAKKLGADAAIDRPFDIDELVTLLRTFLRPGGLASSLRGRTSPGGAFLTLICRRDPNAPPWTRETPRLSHAQIPLAAV